MAAVHTVFISALGQSTMAFACQGSTGSLVFGSSRTLLADFAVTGAHTRILTIRATASAAIQAMVGESGAIDNAIPMAFSNTVVDTFKPVNGWDIPTGANVDYFSLQAVSPAWQSYAVEYILVQD